MSNRGGDDCGHWNETGFLKRSSRCDVVRVAPSAAPEEVAALLRSELEVDASRFTAALAAARFAPLPDAEPAATRAREELARLRDQLRKRLGVVRRVRGLVSLRSLGFTG